jgi:hypothetical protein
MVGALIVLVSEDGIRGAAWAHAVLFVPLALAYGTLGARKIGLDGRRVVSAVVPLVVPFAVQCLVTFGVAALLRAAGIEDGWAALGGAVVGVVSLAVVLLRVPSSPLAEGRAVLADAVGKGSDPLSVVD